MSLRADLAILRGYQLRAAQNYSPEEREDFLALDPIAAFVLSTADLEDLTWQYVQGRADEAMSVMSGRGAMSSDLRVFLDMLTAGEAHDGSYLEVRPKVPAGGMAKSSFPRERIAPQRI